MEAAGAGVREEGRLPPGFRFHPTDEELITYYLTHKITEANFGAKAIADVDLTKCEPWDLPEKAKMGEKEWYFFSLRDRKYPTGVRTNRATAAGYWKTTGKDKEIFSSSSSSSSNTSLVGLKKTLVFYKGRAPRGEKTNWVMHEYRLYPKSSAFTKNNKDEWVVCRVFMKSSGAASASKKNPSDLLQRAANNPYYVDLAQYQPVMPASINNDPNFDVGAARSCPFPNAELMDLTWFARGSHGSNIPLFQPQHSFPGGGFSSTLAAGLNLNLGAASTPMPPPSPQQLRVMPAPMPQVVDHRPPSSSAMANGVDVGSMDGGFSHHVDSCMEQLEGYWSSF